MKHPLIKEPFLAIEGYALQNLKQASLTHQLAEVIRGETSKGMTCYEREGDVGIVRISGSLSHEDSFWNSFFGISSYQEIMRNLQAASEDEAVDRIVLDINSPGGSIHKMEEVTALIRQIKANKEVIAFTSAYCCSAAYFIASQADKIYASETANVGSLGIYSAYFYPNYDGDLKEMRSSASPFKNADLREDKEAEQKMQEQLDHIYKMFSTQIAEGRGVSVEEVNSNYGRGATFIGKQAVDAGLIDGISTLEVLTHVENQQEDDMTKDELKNKYPEACAALQAESEQSVTEAVNKAVAEERGRVLAALSTDVAQANIGAAVKMAEQGLDADAIAAVLGEMKPVAKEDSSKGAVKAAFDASMKEASEESEQIEAAHIDEQESINDMRSIVALMNEGV